MSTSMNGKYCMEANCQINYNYKTRQNYIILYLNVSLVIKEDTKKYTQSDTKCSKLFILFGTSRIIVGNS